MLATTNNNNTTTTTTSTSEIASNTIATTTNALSKATTSFTSLTNMIRNASSLSTMAPSGASNGQQESKETPQVNFKISLEVPLMTPDRLYPTPSMKDNLPFEVEFDLRLMGCELIQTAGRLLKLPQVSSLFCHIYFIWFDLINAHLF